MVPKKEVKIRIIHHSRALVLCIVLGASGTLVALAALLHSLHSHTAAQGLGTGGNHTWTDLQQSRSVQAGLGYKYFFLKGKQILCLSLEFLLCKSNEIDHLCMTSGLIRDNLLYSGLIRVGNVRDNVAVADILISDPRQ